MLKKYLLNGKVRSQLGGEEEGSSASVPSFVPSSLFWGPLGALVQYPRALTRLLTLHEEPEKQASTAWSRTGQKSMPPRAGVGVGVGSWVDKPWSGVKAALSLGKLGSSWAMGTWREGLPSLNWLGVGRVECRRGCPHLV